jgi:hypothetical protein
MPSKTASQNWNFLIRIDILAKVVKYPGQGKQNFAGTGAVLLHYGASSPIFGEATD